MNLFTKTCKACSAKHYLSYATGGRLNASEQLYYPNSTEERFLHVTTAWGDSLVEGVAACKRSSSAAWSLVGPASGMSAVKW